MILSRIEHFGVVLTEFVEDRPTVGSPRTYIVSTLSDMGHNVLFRSKNQDEAEEEFRIQCCLSAISSVLFAHKEVVI